MPSQRSERLKGGFPCELARRLPGKLLQTVARHSLELAKVFCTVVVYDTVNLDLREAMHPQQLLRRRHGHLRIHICPPAAGLSDRQCQSDCTA